MSPEGRARYEAEQYEQYQYDDHQCDHCRQYSFGNILCHVLLFPLSAVSRNNKACLTDSSPVVYSRVDLFDEPESAVISDKASI